MKYRVLLYKDLNKVHVFIWYKELWILNGTKIWNFENLKNKNVKIHVLLTK